MRPRTAGVPLPELRAAVALARQTATPDGVAWGVGQWERIWVRLTDQQQRVVYMHALLGRTYTEVADELGLSRGSVMGAWRRAMVRIRDVVPTAN